MTDREPRPRGPWGTLRGWAKASLSNALELARLGRLTPRDDSSFAVVARHPAARLRRYGDPNRATSAPLLLIPPLMLTAEIYDVAPELSAVTRLAAAGMDPWVVDFGAPEQEEGGMARTLDDHVRAVAWAIDEAHRRTGRPVHLAGYSQGGMFAYQAAAFVEAEKVASVITFGSPVDIHRNVPQLGSDVAAHLIRGLEPLVRMPLDRIEGLPGELTSLGFRLLTPRKELQQLADFLLKLHDRSALEKRESRRRFLGGEGFVAWPGPALVKFFEEFIVHNRLVSGGLVIDGRTLSLADIRCPILTFVGARDDFARPPSIRAIRQVAPHAEVHEIVLAAGHFGLVVGSTSLRDTWPSVAEWIRWQEGEGPEPRLLAAQRPEPRYNDEVEEYFDVEFDYALLGDEVMAAARNVWKRVGEVVRDTGDTVYTLRHQLPRVWQLESMTPDTRISASRILTEQATRAPEDTFFLWRGRAFTYGDAERRVENVARGLIEVGVEPGERIGVLMAGRPTFLSLVTALGRVGAVAVLVSPALDDDALREAWSSLEVRRVVTDPEHAARAASLTEETFVLGGGPDRPPLPDGVRDMEVIDPAAVIWPAARPRDPGRAGDLGLVLVRPGPGGHAKISRVSHGRWAFSALGVSSGASLAPEDTVYCCLPLHHPTGIMVAVGGALVAGARLALSPGFEPESFWPEVRRYGATVVFYAGEMARPLTEAPPSRGDRSHPVRLFAGSGMRADVWLALQERFGVGVVEFYASTERNLVLTNAAGRKIGALGRPLPGSAELAIVAYDWERRELVRRNGRLRRVDAGKSGVAVARLAADAPMDLGSDVVEGAFETGDRWAITKDVLRRDGDGDYWFVGRLDHIVSSADGPIATHRVEDALYGAGARLAVAFAVEGGIGARVVTDAPLDRERFTKAVRANLDPHARPLYIERVRSLPLTEGMRPIKSPPAAADPGDDAAVPLQRLRWHEGAYLEGE